MNNELYRIFINGVAKWVTLQELIMHEARLLEQQFALAKTDACK